MYAALTLDFYGTLVEEDGEVIARIAAAVAADAARAPSAADVSRFWSRSFTSLCASAHGAGFRSQRELEQESLRKTLAEFESNLEAESLSEELYTYWRAPPPLPGAADFVASLHAPACLLSNIDSDDLAAALSSLGWSFARIVTSESARAYKPRREPFEAALRLLDTAPHETLHIGDSVGSDLAGAAALGMPCAWVNRSSRPLPPASRVDHVVADVRELLGQAMPRRPT